MLVGAGVLVSDDLIEVQFRFTSPREKHHPLQDSARAQIHRLFSHPYLLFFAMRVSRVCVCFTHRLSRLSGHADESQENVHVLMSIWL